MEKGHLIIFEKSMNSRFIDLANQNNLDYVTLNMDNSLSGGVIKSVINRIRDRDAIIKKRNELISLLSSIKTNEIYLSNTEGYISINIVKHLIEQFPDKKFIALQHGLFLLDKKTFKITLTKIINKCSFFFTGIYLFGEGFGGIKVDKYIVYGNAEKRFLVDEKKWKEQNVDVNLKFLKSYLLKNYDNKPKLNNVFFLLQSLSSSLLCTERDEHYLINKTVEYLSNKYDTVFIKDHPICKDRLNAFKFPKNTKIVNDLIDGFSQSKSAYSFFSTGLIDAKVFDLNIFAIKSKKIKIKNNVYKLFDNVINFEDEIDT